MSVKERQKQGAYDCLDKCPTCGAAAKQPCQTPAGKLKENIHDTRPFKIG